MFLFVQGRDLCLVTVRGNRKPAILKQSIIATQLVLCVSELIQSVSGQHGWDSIADLNVLLGPVSFEKIIIWESLDSGRFSYRKTTTLFRVIVNEIVAVL